MDNYTPLIIIPALLVILFLFRRRRRARPGYSELAHIAANKLNEMYSTYEEADTAVATLEKLGYYKYAAAGDIGLLKETLKIGLMRYGRLSSEYDSELRLPLDYRLYLLDGEILFEENGFTDALTTMQPLFVKIGLTINLTEEVKATDSDGLLNHSVIINGKRYIIFNDFDDYGCGEAAQRFADIINDQLILQNKDERLYLINYAADGSAIFLTEPQAAFIDKLLKNDEWKPMNVKDWCKAFDVDPTSYLGKK